MSLAARVGVAAVLALPILIGCSVRDGARPLRGQVFLQRNDGGAVKLALARVMFLRAADIEQLSAAAARVKKERQAELDLAELKLQQVKDAAAASEKAPAAKVEAAAKRIEELKANFVGGNVLASYTREADEAKLELLDLQSTNAKTVLAAMQECLGLRAAVRRAVFDAETTPLRPIAVATMTDADGVFSARVPNDCAAVLIEAETGAESERACWIVPVEDIDFAAQPMLFSEHNRHQLAR